MRDSLSRALLSLALLVVSGGLLPTSIAAGAGGREAYLAPAVTTFEVGKQPTLEIHVATDGDDASGDGSPGAPYRTIDRAVEEAVPGAAVRIHAGTYAEVVYVDGLAGTSEAPIWIGGAPGEARPIIEGGGEGMHLSRVRYLIVHDLEVRQTEHNGINCDDGGEYADPEATRHVIFRDLYIHDVGGTGNQDCLKLSGVDDYYVLESEFARCGGGISGSGVDHVGCHGGLLVGNTFREMSGNAVQCKGGSEEIEIRANWIDGGGQRAVNMGGSTGFTYFRPPLSTTEPNVEARDIRVVANVIRGSVAPLAFVGCVDCLAAHNTIVDPENWLLRILQETTSTGEYTFLECQNNAVVNNLFYFDRSALSTYATINIGPHTQEETFTFANNLWYAYDDPAQSAPTPAVPETDGIVGQNPQLVDPAGENYHLQAGSPATGAGQALPGISHDFSGRSYQTPPSIGAFEYHPLDRRLYLPLILRP